MSALSEGDNMPTQRLLGKGATPTQAELDLEARAAEAGLGTIEGQRTYEVSLYQGKKKVGKGLGETYISAQGQALQAAGITQEVVVSGEYQERVAVQVKSTQPLQARAAGAGPAEPTTARYTTWF